MDKISVACIIAICSVCCQVSKSAIFDSIFLNQGRQQLLTIVDKDKETCVLVPKQQVRSGFDSTLKVSKNDDTKVKAFAVFTNGDLPFPPGLEPACLTFNIAIALYHMDIFFLQHKVSKAGRPPRFCILSTDERYRIDNKLQCDDSLNNIHHAISRSMVWVTGKANGTPTEPTLLGSMQGFTANVNIVSGFVNAIGTIANLVLDLFGLSEPPPDETPPQFTSCPYVPAKMIPRGETTVRVDIPRPTYADDRDDPGECRLTESPTLNGMELPAGSYEVTFTVSDSSGNIGAPCKVPFTVGGTTCTMPTTFPPHIASISCTPNVGGPAVWGTVCEFSCLPGYETSGANTRTCENVGGVGVWLPTNQVECGASVCNAIPAPQHGTVTCTHENYYRSICRVDCEAGYLPEDQSKRSAMCQANSRWDDELTACKDVQPPIFVSCPTDIVAFADRNRETTDVTWEEPTAIDKISNDLNVPAHVQLTEGSPPGSTFTRGQHLIKYTATDASSNEALCSFKVEVQVITCPPIRYTLKAELSCPSGYVYGSTCTFGCETGYPVVGPTSFSCERDFTSSEPVGYWDWGFNRTQPFCQIVPCPDLRAPDNGALACDGWAYGTFCLIMCNENWDVPHGTPERYVCETLSGTWNPDDDVPDCALPRDPDSMNLPSELYYYSGDCRDPETQAQIQENFIAILNSSDYSDICRLFVECAAENVVVVCGNVTTRSGQPSYQLQVKFDLTVKVKAQAANHTSYIDVENTLFSMANRIDEEVKEGKFSLNNVTAINVEVQSDSFTTSPWTNLVCDPGYQPNYNTYTCQGCPKGSYLDTDKGKCEKCAVGKFQDKDGQLACKPCRPGTWTVKNGSRAMDLCLDTCQAGWYSDTGMKPCAQCEMGHYQSTTGQRQCHRCPHGKTTTTFGAKALNECVGIDLVLNVSSRVQLTETPPDMQGITVSFWIRPHSGNGSILHLERETNMLLTVGNPGSLEVGLTSTVLTTGISLDDGKWHSIAVTLRDVEKDCKVYVDGAEAWSQRLPSNAHTVFPANTYIVLGDAGGGSFVGDISALSAWNGTLPESTLLQMSQRCSYDDTDAVVTWVDVIRIAGMRERQRVPSICDDHNDCDSNPCGEHAIGCEDHFGFYSCACEEGYTGAHCEVNIDDCHEGSCKNGGTCVDGVANFTCICPNGFKGRLCEREIVNGGWGEWTDWTPCSATCGNGTHQRWRQCNNPPPEDGGLDCAGLFTESGTCNVQDCPVCLELKRPDGVIMNCYRNDTEEKNYCQIDCAPGLEFSEKPHPLYTCGAESQYKWNHQTENNPTAILPSCAHGRIPSKLSIDYELKYPELYCDSPVLSASAVEVIKGIGSQNVQDIDCVKRKICNVTLEVHHCDTSENSQLPASLSIVLCEEVNSTYNSGVLEVNGNMTDEGHAAVITLAEAIIDLVSATEDIKNKSNSNMFDVVIDGRSFAVDANGTEPMIIADCRAGMVAQRMVCVYCAPGTFFQNRMCIKCPKGSFQELEGQVSCIPCPEGLTTAGLGSNNYSDCYVEPEIQTEEPFIATTDDLPLPTSTPTYLDTDKPGEITDELETQTKEAVSSKEDGLPLTTITPTSMDPDKPKEETGSNEDNTTIAIAVVIPIALLVLGLGIGVFVYRRKRADPHRKDQRLMSTERPKHYECFAMQPRKD